MNEYDKQANDFAKEVGLTMIIEGKTSCKHFPDDEQPRDIYTITLKNDAGTYTFKFGQSLADSDHYKINSRNGNPVLGAPIFTEIDKAKKTGFTPVKVLGSKPRLYSVLACLTKYDPGTFENFCDDFGYDPDSRKAYNIYLEVCQEWQNISRLFNEQELEKLAEI